MTKIQEENIYDDCHFKNKWKQHGRKMSISVPFNNTISQEKITDAFPTIDVNEILSVLKGNSGELIVDEKPLPDSDNCPGDIVQF